MSSLNKRGSFCNHLVLINEVNFLNRGMMLMMMMGLSCVSKRNLVTFTIFKSMNTINVNSSTAVHTARLIRRSQRHPFYSTLDASTNDKDGGKVTLAKNLASLVEETSKMEDRRPKTRIELLRSLQLQIKKRVKEQFMDGKFHNLVEKVIANPKTLQDAYNCIRVNSNVDLESDGDNLPFESMSEALCRGDFDVKANTTSMSSRGTEKNVLVLPNLKLKVIQEAIKIVLEVVYKPHFSKISHGCRSGRSHSSALKYICKEMSKSNWCFTLLVNKELDSCILSKLFSTMENTIEDSRLYAIIERMNDAQVLNLEFGGFPKGHGLPQEGVLSPILMNIYLDLFDREFYRMSMKYEVFDGGLHIEQKESYSNLRSWFRRQMNDPSVSDSGQENSGVRVHSCRFMDEMLCVISGPEDVALSFKSDIQNYLHNFLHLDVDYQSDILPCSGPQGVRFLGTLVKRSLSEHPSVRVVHKLKKKVGLFALQKRDAWDAWTVRIGKKWLAYGLKEVKKSEIQHLAMSNSVLRRISQFRKAGMKTDHWYNVLLKIWMQDMNVRSADNEESILSKYIVEQALPQELKDSFYKFQKCAEDYVSSETASTLALLSDSSSLAQSILTTEVIAPVNVIMKRLLRYGLINSEGIPRTCHMLVMHDTNQIIDWFTGIAERWLKWYRNCNNFIEVKLIISNQVRKSCIRTLAAKYRIYETEIEKKFDSELSRISLTDDMENEMANETADYQLHSVDEALMYGISCSGLCLLSLAMIVSQSQPCNCFVMGCQAAAPCVYTLHVMERQKFPGWKTGFSSCIHPSLDRRQIGLCKHHLKDLYLGHISLQSIDFGAWR